MLVEVGGRGMVLQIFIAVQGGDGHVMGCEQVLVETSSVRGDRVPFQNHHT